MPTPIEEAKAAATRLSALTINIANASKANVPPARNSANQYFFNAIVTGAPTPVDPGSQALTNEVAIRMYQMGSSIYGAIDVIIKNHPPVDSNDIKDIVWDNLDTIVAAIGGWIGGLTALFSGEFAASLPVLKQALEETLKVVNQKELVPKGTNPNGFISTDIRAAATTLVGQFNQPYTPPANTPEEVITLEAAYRKVCIQMMTALQQLPIENNDPWLLAVWQIGFQATCEATSLALQSILAQPQPAARTATT